MRILVIMQALLILVGAYYIYTLHQASTIDGSDEVTKESNEAAVTDSNSESSSVTPDEESATTTNASTTIEADISGPNDAGMEYPIPDNEANLQVR